MDPLAAPVDLATYLQKATQAEADAGSTDVLDTGIALRALTSASGAIRSVCGWSISQETVTVSLPQLYGATVFLPTLRLIALAVTVNGAAVVDGVDFRWERNGTVRFNRAAWWVVVPDYATAPAVTLTYTHGYAPVPDEIQAVCLERAALSYLNPEMATSSTVGSVTQVYRRTDADLASDPRLAAYRLPTVG